MRVSELVKLLESMPQDADVILQADPEGNSFHLLREVDGDAIWRSEPGDVLSTNWTWQEACFPTPEDWEAFKSGRPRCVVLSPR